MVKHILEGIGIPVLRSRFVWNGYHYPIKIVVFEGQQWGHFDAAYYQIALNRKLLYLAKDSVVRDVIQHELAHYLTFLRHGDVMAPHGQEFKETCAHYGFSKHVAEATMNIDTSNELKEGDLNSEKVLEKVKKLFQLAESSNTHEAELATMKANALLLRHNLDFVNSTDDEPIYLDRVMIRPRKDAKMNAIYDILRHFMVRTVFSHGHRSCCIEISGPRTNVKLAKYVADFLDKELDQLWTEAKHTHRLEGLRAKNSFFIGVAKGYEEKMNETKSHFSSSDQKALTTCQKSLEIRTNIIYKKLSSSYSQRRTDFDAGSIGKEKGKKLNVRQGVESKQNGLYLPW